MGLLDDAIREHLDLKRRRGADPTEIERAEREALGPVRREPTMSSGFGDEGSSPAAVTDAPPAEFSFAAEVGEFAGEPPTTVTPAEDAAPIAAPDYADPEFDDFAAIEPPAGGSGLELEPAPPLDPEPEPVFEPVAEPDPKPKRRHLFGRHRHEEDERPPLPAELPDDDPFLSAGPVTPEPAGDGEAVGRAQPIPRDTERPAPTDPPPALRISPESEPGNTVEYDVEQAFLEEDEVEPAPAEDILEETPDFLADTPDHDRLWFEQKPPPDFDFDN